MIWGCSSVGRAPHLHCGGRRFDSDPPLKKKLYLRILEYIYYCGGSVIGNTLSFQGRDVGSTPALRSTFGQRGYLTIEN
jgi:hypothetical protein